MKATSKLLKTVSRYLSAKKSKQYENTKCFTDVLKKLKQKERQLKKELENEKNDKARKKIKQKLCIVYEQRKKGVSALKKVKYAK